MLGQSLQFRELSSRSINIDRLTPCDYRLYRKVLRKTGLSMEDVDLFEVNEAFASMMVYTIDQLKIPLDKLNVNGGAMYVHIFPSSIKYTLISPQSLV